MPHWEHGVGAMTGLLLDVGLLLGVGVLLGVDVPDDTVLDAVARMQGTDAV